MFNKLRNRAEEEKGFTLIELLVVILIIGILAAIAIPAFLNQKGKAYDSNAKSDARTAQTAEETYFTDNNAYATGATGLASLEALEPTINNAMPAPLTREPRGGSPGDRHLQRRARRWRDREQLVPGHADVEESAGVLYALTRRSDGTVERTCNVPAGVNAGGCKTTTGTTGDGTW